MPKRPLLPAGINAPLRMQADGFHLRTLRLSDAAADYAAVMDSAADLKGRLDPGSSWPDGLTLYLNSVDLGWHEKEFQTGCSFAWTVMAADEGRCLGCAYLYPSDRAGFDAMGFWWARTGSGLDAAIGVVFRAGMAALPLTVAWPGRDIPWADWATTPLA